MKGYFARLVARAAGSAAVAPNARRPNAPDGDPFETAARLESTPAPPSTRDVPAMTPPKPLGERVRQRPVPHESEPVPDRREPRGPALLPGIPAPVRLALPSGPVLPPSQPSVTERETVYVEREREREVVHSITEKLAPSKPPVAPFAQSAREREPEPGSAAEPAEPRPEPKAPVPASTVIREREIIRQLEPAPAKPEVVAPLPTPGPEPRLVIGRLVVDVLPPAAPARTPQTVRIVERAGPAARSAPAFSRAGFGFGQM